MAMTIESLIDSERWIQARAAIRRALRAEPNHHWLLTRLSLTYYEQRRYALALKYAKQAFSEKPTCPLVLWDYACTLQMRGRHGEALDLYARLVTRDPAALANDECGEGKAWAKGLVADAHYRASLSLKALGHHDASQSAFEYCLDLRGPGCRSIYRLDELHIPNYSTRRISRMPQRKSRARRSSTSQS